MPGPPQRPIAFFAHERGDARVAKRVAALQDQGRKVLGFMFHRVRDKPDGPLAWENIDLGTTYNRRYFQRLWALAASVGVLWKQRHRLAECGSIYVVNTDNAVLALIARRLAGREIPLVLELADIQPAMTGGGAVGCLLRWVERRVLARAALLVTTSPGFIHEYFEPFQGYRGATFLLENKVYPSAGLPPSSVAGEPVEGGRPWVVGGFGALRCRRSIEVMHALARRLGGRVRFVLRGYPSGTIGGEFATLLGDHPDLLFGGPYVYPDDLAGLYAAVDFNWAFDMADPNGNSAWLLPNRIYEGGCFATPLLAGAGTETGRWTEGRGLGWTFAEPLEDSLAQFFETLTVERWREVKARCLASPREAFTGEGDYRRLAERLAELEVAAG